MSWMETRAQRIIETLKRAGWLSPGVLLFLFASCGQKAATTPTTATVAPSPSPLALSSLDDMPTASGAPRYLRVKLTINQAGDLRVKAGDKIEAGATLSDRAFERRRLMIQRRALVVAVRRIDQQSAAAQESIKLLATLGGDLPPATFASESAAIRRAEVDAQAAARKVALQQERLASLPGIVPAGFDAGAVESHENIKLALVQDAQRQAVADVEGSRAKLQAAKESRAIEEKRAKVDYARQMLAARSQLQQTESARAQLEAQIAAIDAQLAQLVAVRAPFGGTVKRIEWEEMDDAAIIVFVTLTINR